MGALALRPHKPSARAIRPHLPPSRPQVSGLEGKEEKEAGESISSSSRPFYEATGLWSDGSGLRGRRVFQAWLSHLKDSLVVPLKRLPLRPDQRVAAAWRLSLPAALCRPAFCDSTAPPAGGCLPQPARDCSPPEFPVPYNRLERGEAPLLLSWSYCKSESIILGDLFTISEPPPSFSQFVTRRFSLTFPPLLG